MPSWVVIYIVLLFLVPAIFVIILIYGHKIWPRHPTWIRFFRICRISEEKVTVTPPILFGMGYVFDIRRRLVSIRRWFLIVIPVAKREIPFSDIIVHRYDWSQRSGPQEVTVRASFEITTASGGRFRIGETMSAGESAQKILDAIERMGIKVRTAHTAPPGRKAKHMMEYIDGEKVIYKHRVWLRETGLRRKKLRLTTYGVSIEGLPEIPHTSIKGCEIKTRHWPHSPYLSLEFVDSLGDTKQVKLFHPAFVSSETLPEIEKIYDQIMGARSV